MGRMLCSPSHLFIDMVIWYSPGFYEAFAPTYENASEGADYDCALISVPCDSNITSALVTFDTSLFYWFDILVIYGFLSCLVAVGIIGNIINVFIFSTTHIASDSTNSLLLALSVSDLLTLLLCTAIVVNFFLCFVDEGLALTTYNLAFPQASVMSRWFGLLSLDFVTVISVQRALAVIFPFKITAIFSRRNTHLILAALVCVHIGSVAVVNVCLFPRWLYHPYFGRQVSLGYMYRLLPYQVIIDYMTYYLSIRSAFDLILLSVTGFVTVIRLRSQARIHLTMKTDTTTKKIDGKELELVKSFKNLGQHITNNGKCDNEVKTRIAMAK